MSPVRLNRRAFLRGASAAAALTIVPRAALGGQGVPAASDRLNLAIIEIGRAHV